MESEKWPTTADSPLLGRNSPVTEKMEKVTDNDSDLIIEFIQFVVKINTYFNEKTTVSYANICYY